MMVETLDRRLRNCPEFIPAHMRLHQQSRVFQPGGPRASVARASGRRASPNRVVTEYLASRRAIFKNPAHGGQGAGALKPEFFQSEREMKPNEPADSESTRRASLIVRYAVAAGIVLLVSAYLIALVAGFIPETQQIDFPALIFLLAGVGAAILVLDVELLGRVRIFQVASLRIELDQLRRRQEVQSDRLEVMQLLLPLLIPEAERKHLLNLHHGEGKDYLGSDILRQELRRLRYVRLIDSRQPVANIKDGKKIDLADFVALTPLGIRWASEIEGMQSPKQDAAGDQK
jgi:hypothetical protein